MSAYCATITNTTIHVQQRLEVKYSDLKSDIQKLDYNIKKIQQISMATQEQLSNLTPKIHHIHQWLTQNHADS